MSQPNDDFSSAGKNVYETPLEEEARRSFLEYSYSVITSRALPDARDGLKPVHRRILFSMSESGLRPDHSFVKSARVVGDCMGKYHPHGDSAIYEALVRLTQDFALNTPLVSGHGNFGSPNDGPAASRYTECRLSPAAMLLVNELDENTVDFAPNYDGSIDEPEVLPAAYPNLLVNGTSGIAVGMATNMIPHNLGEAIEAARLLIKKPKATLDDLMEIIPGPDLPTGGQLLGEDEIRRAYEEGRGSVRIRGKAEVLPLEGSRGRSMIAITELPYGVGTEKVIEKIKDELGKKRLQGISDVKDLSDRRNGLRLVIETKTGVNPTALLSDLYRYTPLETSFGIANLTLVNGEPRTLSLKELLEVFLAHRYEVVTRRTQYRKDKAEARKHIVDGLLIALDNIDEVVRIIKSSADTSEARANLCKRFDLSEIQAGHILDMPLRRLVSLEVENLKDELAQLAQSIADYNRILGDEKELKAVVDAELLNVKKQFATERKTELIPGSMDDILAQAQSQSIAPEIENEAVEIYLSSTHLLARTAAPSEEAVEMKRAAKKRAKHDTIISALVANTHDEVLAITNYGNAYKFNVLDVPSLPKGNGRVVLKGGISAKELVDLDKGETIVGLAPISHESARGIAIATRQGAVKVNNFDIPQRSASFPIIGLKDGDEVISASVNFEGDNFVLITSDASLLTFSGDLVRPQGRSGGGVTGIKLSEDATLNSFSLVSEASANDAVVVTSTGETVKVSSYQDFPSKGRGTGGVRAHKMLKTENAVIASLVSLDPVGATEKGEPVDLPSEVARRDASGSKLNGVASLGRGYTQNL
jgi:DNA gyrase subunit A